MFHTPRLALNSQISSCLSPWSVGITGMGPTPAICFHGCSPSSMRVKLAQGLEPLLPSPGHLPVYSPVIKPCWCLICSHLCQEIKWKSPCSPCQHLLRVLYLRTPEGAEVSPTCVCVQSQGSAGPGAEGNHKACRSPFHGLQHTVEGSCWKDHWGTGR